MHIIEILCGHSNLITICLMPNIHCNLCLLFSLSQVFQGLTSARIKLGSTEHRALDEILAMKREQLSMGSYVEKELLWGEKCSPLGNDGSLSKINNKNNVWSRLALHVYAI